MMGAVEKEDLDELIKILKQAIKDAEQLVDNTAHGDHVERCRENVRNFHTTGSMLGLTPLEQIGLALEDYIARELVASDRVLGMPEVFPFAHAASALVDEMRGAASGGEDLPLIPRRSSQFTPSPRERGRWRNHGAVCRGFSGCFRAGSRCASSDRGPGNTGTARRTI